MMKPKDRVDIIFEEIMHIPLYRSIGDSHRDMKQILLKHIKQVMKEK